MAHQFRLGNWLREESSPVREARQLRYMRLINSSDNHASSSSSSPPRLFGSSLGMVPTSYNALGGSSSNNNNNPSTNSHFINGGLARASFIPARETGAGPAVGYDYQRSGPPAGNSSNANSISSFYGGINNNTTTTGGPSNDDDPRRANLLLKRSRSPNALNRGETSAQGSQGDEGSSRRRTLPSFFHTHQDNVNMSSSSSSTSWRDFDNMMNEAALAREGPSTYGTTSATWSPLYSPPRGTIGLFEDDRPIPYHNAPHSDFLTEPLNIPSMLRRQEHPRTNFNIGRHDPSPASRSAYASFLYPSTITGGARGSSSRSTSRRQNNNNNVDIFDLIHEQRMDEAYAENMINVQQHARLLPGGRVNRFSVPTINLGMPSSFVPPRQPPPPSDPSSSNYRLNPPPPPPRSRFSTVEQTGEYMQTNSTFARSENPSRPGSNNHIFISTSNELREERNALRDEIFNTIHHLRNGGSARVEDLLLLDCSIVLNLLDSQELMDQMNDSDDWPYEIISALESDQWESVETGLTEQEIFRYIQQETYRINLEETSTQNQTCTICQEDYVKGERIGRLDCMHIFHLDCIKQWLELKNVCPICNQTALEIDEDEEET